MEKTPRIEKFPKVDYLSESLRLSFIFDEIPSQYVPEVTPDDLETRIEKYRILLGAVEEIAVNSVRIRVASVLEMQDEPGYYTESYLEVRNVNVPAIQAYVDHMRARDPHFAGQYFVGDIHTHPVLPKDFENGAAPWSPSQGDVDDIVSLYENGTLDKHSPFIFGIGGPDEQGVTHYGFYRMVVVDGTYRVMGIEVDET